SVEQWVNQRLGGYVKLAVAERRSVAKTLHEDGLSKRAIAEVIGVDESTVRADFAAGNPAPRGVDTEERSGGKPAGGERAEDLWVGMPSFVMDDLRPHKQVLVNLACQADVEAFEKIIGQRIPNYEKRTPSIWFPQAEIGRTAGKRYVDETAAVDSTVQ